MKNFSLITFSKVYINENKQFQMKKQKKKFSSAFIELHTQ